MSKIRVSPDNLRRYSEMLFLQKDKLLIFILFQISRYEMSELNIIDKKIADNNTTKSVDATNVERILRNSS